jgi:hypothetical protein
MEQTENEFGIPYKEPEVKNEEQEAKLNAIVKELGATITGTLARHSLTYGEGMTVMATAVLDVLDTLSDVMKQDRKETISQMLSALEVGLEG